VQVPGEHGHGGLSPTGNEEEVGKSCCATPPSSQTGALSKAVTELSTAGSDTELQEALPQKQQ